MERWREGRGRVERGWRESRWGGWKVLTRNRVPRKDRQHATPQHVMKTKFSLKSKR